MSKSAQAVLLAVLGLALLVSGFSGGFIAGHFLPLDKGFPTALAPAVATTPAANSATPADLEQLFKPFWEAWQLVHTQFVDQPVDDTRLMQGAMRGMMDALGDPQSSYMDPSTFESANAGLEGSYEGIGAVVDTSGKYLTIISTFPSSPAENAGLRSGDQIIGLDRQDLKGMDPEVVRQKVKGPAGTTVHLTIARAGESKPLEFDITRGHITTDAVTSKILDGGIGYIKIPTFGSNTTKELTAALRTLMAQKPRGLILDLRDNGGGYLETSVEVVSQFQSSGVVLYEEYGDGRRKPYDVVGGGLATRIPMVVLINEGSASASEITAGALQDYGRATLVGVTSYGKGSVQNWVPVSNDQGAVRITIARWLTPNDRQIDRKGLTPDVYVEISEADRAAGRDPQLDAGVDTLERVIAGRPIPTSVPTAVPTVTP
ncbi:MAG TPA: S41 family peptidase [Anaerolineales bacterium]|nr:S41 family peptidase [Anaerolineales bacterium]